MQKFSDRIGATAPPELARDEISQKLRVRLWNIFQPRLFHSLSQPNSKWRAGIKKVHEFLAWRVSDISYQSSTETNRLEEWFFYDKLPWYQIYNLIEYLVSEHWSDASITARAELVTAFNEALQLEGSRFRFVGTLVTEITDPTELQAIAEAQRAGDRFAGAREHINTALSKLSLRPEPDYRNAIKEAISAVESTLKALTGKDHSDLADALKQFAQAHPIHTALFKGLMAIYGYTSNEPGLRHSLLDADANVGFAEAKLMIVVCATFMNFLILKSNESNRHG